MDIGTKIRMIRKSKGITQIDLAANAGIAVNSLRLYEANKRQPRADQLRAIASALGVSVADLLDVKPAHAVDPNETPEDKEKRLGMREGTLSNAQRAEDVEAQNKADMLEAMDKLNIPGQQEAVKRVQEMADIDRYKRRTFSDVWNYGKDGKPPK
jgi:DNA-binding helix-turn-helix protein